MLNAIGLTLALGGVVVAAVGMAPLSQMSAVGLAMSVIGAVVYVVSLSERVPVPDDVPTALDIQILDARSKHKPVKHLLALKRERMNEKLRG